MNKINNLIYGLEINFVNNEGIKSSIAVNFCDDGLKCKTVRVGNDCVTEETINGRVLSGRLDNLDGFCGYRYDYQDGENLLNINPNVSINDAVSLINKVKRKSDFLAAELVLSSVLRNDYRVVILNKGNVNIIKTVAAENEKAEQCSVQEIVNLSKLSSDEYFSIQDKIMVYQMGDKSVVEENDVVVGSEIKSQLSELLDILNKTPQNYKELIDIKNQIQTEALANSVNEEKGL